MSPKLNQIKSILFTSCFSTKKSLSSGSMSPESFVSGVQGTLKSIQSKHNKTVMSIPTVYGLDGGAIVHPNHQLCPIVQVKPDKYGGSSEEFNNDCFILQESLTEHIFSVEIAKAKGHFIKMLDAFKRRKMTQIEKFKMLEHTVSLIAKETEPFFDMYIKLAHMRGYLLEGCFIFDPINGAVPDRILSCSFDGELLKRVNVNMNLLLAKKSSFDIKKWTEIKVSLLKQPLPQPGLGYPTLHKKKKISSKIVI